jgi:hypothetical protein
VRKATYSVRLRKDSRVCDVMICEEEREFRIVNTFNHESEAWQWITEQEQVRGICARLERDGPRKR